MDHNQNNKCISESQPTSGRTSTSNNPELTKKLINGANWFYWIAAISLLNTLTFLTDGEWSLVFGLGITQLIDGICWEIAMESGSPSIQIIGFLNNIVILCFLGMMGGLARQKKGWAFIAGIILYGFDTLLFIWAFDIVGIAFHGFALYLIYQGYQALGELDRIQIKPIIQTEAILPNENSKNYRQNIGA